MPMFSNAKYHSVDPYGGYLAYLFQVFTDSLSDVMLFSIFTYTEPEDRCRMMIPMNFRFCEEEKYWNKFF